MIRNSTLILSTIFIFTSCNIHKIHYIGTTHEPTNKVDVYVNPNSIHRAYDEVGLASFTNIQTINPEKFQKRLEKKAREKGADAVLFRYYQPGRESSIINTADADTVIFRHTTTPFARPDVSNMIVTFLKYR